MPLILTIVLMTILIQTAKSRTNNVQNMRKFINACKVEMMNDNRICHRHDEFSSGCITDLKLQLQNNQYYLRIAMTETAQTSNAGIVTSKYADSIPIDNQVLLRKVFNYYHLSCHCYDAVNSFEYYLNK
mgnify:CR=1 FL=1